MRYIPLTKGKVAIVDDADFDELNKHKWQAQKGAYTYYAVRHDSDDHNKTIRMHRLLLNAPPGQDCDHINGNGLDNRRANLRFCTRTQNLWNQRPRGNTSRYKGVCWNKANKNWIAQINIRGYTEHIGSFDTEIDAARAFDIKAREGHGEFARLNLPEEST